jgi:integrase
VCGLRWSDLDSDARTLSIKRSIASVPGGTIVKDTKSHAARRISLDDDTIAILELQRDRVRHRAEVCQLAFNDDGYVFTATADGSEPLHPDTITKGFARVQKRTGLNGPDCTTCVISTQHS